MRKTILLYISIFFSLIFFGRNNTQDSLPGIINKSVSRAESPPNKASSNSNIRIRCLATQVSNEPLFILDGIPIDNAEVGNINPNDIESISVLKVDTAGAIFCSRAENGVILITTKSSLIRKFVVKDFLDGNPIAGATVIFISSDKKDTVVTIADDKGMVVTSKLRIGNDYKIEVSSIGYKTSMMVFKNNYSIKSNEILLERSIKNCVEAVVVSDRKGRKVVCRFKITYSRNSTINADNGIPLVKLYPNPIQQNNSLSIEYVSDKSAVVTIRIVDMSGKIVQSLQENVSEGKNRISVFIDLKWAKGIYIVDLLDEKNTRINQQKLVIQ